MYAECKSTHTDSQFTEVEILKFLQILNITGESRSVARKKNVGSVCKNLT